MLRKTNSRVVIIALLVVVTGVLMLWFSDASAVEGKKTLRAVLRNAGAFFVGTAAIALLWELATKRVFMRELLEAVRLSSDIRTAGIEAFTLNYLQTDWDSFFRDSREVDFFFSYAETWRKVYVKQMRDLASRSDVSVRVLLPDPEKAQLVTTLSHRFSTEEGQIKRKIKDAAQYFDDIFEESTNEGAEVSIWFTKNSPEFAFYRFDNRGVITFFNHLGRTGKVPVFEVSSGGTLFEFARDEFDVMAADARRYVPESEREVQNGTS